jgi:hypothetical protein
MSRKYHATQTVTITGDSCSTEVTLNMSVAFTVHPGCKQTLTDAGEEPSVEVDSIKFREAAQELNLGTLDRLFSDDQHFHSWLLSEAAEQHQSGLDDAAEAKRDERELDNDLPW